MTAEPTPRAPAREPIAIAGHRGYRYAELAPSLARALPAWLEQRTVSGGVEIKRGRVHRSGDYLVKFFGPETQLRARLRPAAAIRSADRHVAVRAVRTPKPYAALERRERGRVLGSMLVTEFVEGGFLSELWGEDRAAMQAFPEFMARMVRGGVFHGDFHLQNAVWDGAQWVLLDLGAVRHAFRNLFSRRVIETQWARAWLGLERPPEFRASFEAFLVAAQLPWDPADAWERVRIRSERWRSLQIEDEGGGPA